MIRESLLRFSPFLCLFLLVVVPAAATPSATGESSVKAVLLYGPDCSECDELLSFYVPGLLQLHGERLELAGIDVGQSEGAALYQAAAQHYGLPSQWSGEPILLVGGRSLSGLLAIGTTLGDELDQLSTDADALHWPPVPGLAELLPRMVENVRSRAVQADPLPALTTSDSDDRQEWRSRIGNALGLLVLLGMIGAIGHSLQRLRGRVWRPALYSQWIVAALILGLGISSYTAYTSLADVAPVCGPVGDCAKVQHSEYSRIAGIPMGVLGLVGYGAILFTWLVARRCSPGGGGWRWLPWAIALVSVLFSLRLTAISLFVIGATCLWCLGSAVAVSVLLWLLSGQTLSPGQARESERCAHPTLGA